MNQITNAAPGGYPRAVPDGATSASFASPAATFLAQVQPPTVHAITTALTTAATAESPEYTDGILAGLNLAGRSDLAGPFLESLLAYAAQRTGSTLNELVGRQVASGGAR